MGFELGAAAIAAIIVMGPLVLAMGVVVAITWPEIEVVPMMIVFIAGGLILPMILYPVSYTMWQAIDLMMRPVEPEHFDLDHIEIAEPSDAAERSDGSDPT